MGRLEAKIKCTLPTLPHASCGGLATHICLVPEPWDAEGLQQVTATQQQDPQLYGEGTEFAKGVSGDLGIVLPQ